MSATSVSTHALAISGGTPVRATYLPYGRQSIDEVDIQAVVEVLRSDWLTTGPKVGEFEEAFAARVGAKHAVSVSSGTAALHAAAFAAGLKAGDEAITTPLRRTAFCIRGRRRCLPTSVGTHSILIRSRSRKKFRPRRVRFYRSTIPAILPI